MRKRIWVLVDRESKEVLDKANTYQEANEMIRLYEKLDIRAGSFKPDTYEIVCKFSDENVSNIALNEYQEEAMKTGKDVKEEHKYQYLVYGLLEEAGEVAGKFKRVLREHNGKFTDTIRRDIALELGDNLWYLAVLADSLGFRLSEIAEMNIEKIENRVKNGTICGSGDNR